MFELENNTIQNIQVEAEKKKKKAGQKTVKSPGCVGQEESTTHI